MKTPLLDKIIRYLKSEEWPVERLPETTSVWSSFDGENGPYELLFRTREDEQDVTVVARYAARVPEEMRVAMAEFLARANYGLVLGNFQMDFSDGEIGYKSAICARESVELLGNPILEEVIYTAVVMMDRHYPAVMGVLDGSLTPAEAAEDIEVEEDEGEEHDGDDDGEPTC